MPLQPGSKAPDFSLDGLRGQVSSSDWKNQRKALIFFPADLPEEVSAGLKKFQDNHHLFAELGAPVCCITNASPERLAQIIPDGDALILLADPSAKVLRQYQVIDEGGRVAPTLYLIDETGAIAAAYTADRYPGLPNPAAVARALRKLDHALRPAPPQPEDHRLGPPDAPVVLIEYSDYECQHCARLHTTLKELTGAYPGRVSLIHRHLPLQALHPHALLAAEAAEAAGAQGKFWEMHDRLFEAEGALEREDLLRYAFELGLDLEKFQEALDTGRFKEPIVELFRSAVRCGIKLTPTLFVNGLLVENPRDEKALRSQIEALLQQS